MCDRPTKTHTHSHDKGEKKKQKKTHKAVKFILIGGDAFLAV